MAPRAEIEKSADQLREMARNIRCHALNMVHSSNSSHIGTCLSMADILAVLYGGVLNLRPQEPSWSERDRFILSKGHGAAGLYGALCEAGFIEAEALESYCQDGSPFMGHVNHKGIPGVEASTGSLGHGLSIASGMALAAKADGASYRAFCILGDGECDEGSVWEAALFAPPPQARQSGRNYRLQSNSKFRPG